jgi:hypothetical protein
VADIRGGARFTIAFDDDLWRQEVERFAPHARGRIAAEAARRVLERDGVGKDGLAACEAQGPDGTRLRGWVKLRIPLARPASEAPYGFVLEPVLDERGRLALRLVAFGERHPREGTRSVYERAHNRRHGAWPTRS